LRAYQNPLRLDTPGRRVPARELAMAIDHGRRRRAHAHFARATAGNDSSYDF
jgi:hypothetical protein